MNLQDFLTTYAAPPSLDPKKIARALVEDPKVHAWLDAEGWGETTLQSLRMGGCLLFGEALVEASDGALHLYGIGYANELGDPEEGSYEHIVAYDPSTDRAIVPPPALRRCTLSDGRTFIARLGPIRLLASESVLWSVAWPFGAAEEQVIAMSDCRPRWDDPAVKTR